ncbi:uncharacterized protein LOC117300094 [Asterias rubens]|uniref:uncharacterized protein LOC117300094 n=1 Tax=Asterias rubens TaxID=7604 RepID=UPI00145584E0|nr:uncharacterized protein LOC117300094 [Asterias rubens]
MISPKMSKHRAVVGALVCSIVSIYVFYSLYGRHVSRYTTLVPIQDQSEVKGTTQRHSTPTPVMEYEFVIAHYDENLDWLKPVASFTHVYDKSHFPGSKPSFSVKDWQELPNVGREGHTYLYHIINNYENLANVTVFLQGKIDNHGRSKTCYPTPTKFLEKARSGVPCILIGKHTNWGRIAFDGKWKAEYARGTMRHTNGTFGQFFRELFGRAPPQFIEHCWSACFSATRKCLQKYPKAFYQKMISYVDDHPNPEEGHYIERLWRFIAVC